MNSYFIQHVEQRLKDAGVDIYQPNFWESEEFQPFKEEYYLGGLEGKITIREIVERYILSEDQVNNLYLSKYDMGNHIALSDDDCQYTELAAELDRLYNHSLSVDPKEFYRSNGLRDRIKKYLLLDLDKYKDIEDYYYERNTAEVFKLLFLLYQLENVIYKDRNILKMLGNPSLENVDNSMVGLFTSNGNIMRDLKDNVEREISMEYRGNVKKTLWEIITDWQSVIFAISGIIDYSEEHGLHNDMDALIEKYSKIAICIETDKIPNKYEGSPIEQFYLKLCQHENLGREKDILFVNAIEIKHKKRTEEQIRVLNELRTIIVEKSQVGKYIETYYKEIAELVYLRDNVSASEKETLCKSIDKVNLILDFFSRETNLFLLSKNKVDVTFIISCLQAVVLSEQNEKFNYKFPAYDKVSRTPRSVRNALNYKEVEVFDALKTYFVRKVMECWNSNLGRESSKKQMNVLENICDTFVYKVLEISNMGDMKLAHDYLIKQISHDIFNYPQKKTAKEFMEKKLDELGYKYIDPENIIGDSFYMSAIMDENLNELLGNFKKKISDESRDDVYRLSFDYEISASDGFVVAEQHMEYIVDKVNHIVQPSDRFESIRFANEYLSRLKMIGIPIIES